MFGTQSSSIFGKPTSAFGAQTSQSFGMNTTQPSIFGSNTAQTSKPFGGNFKIFYLHLSHTWMAEMHG